MPPVAVDTNMLVRLATADEPKEHLVVSRSLAERRWRVFLTVVLETEWVLRSVYGYSPAQFAQFVEWMDASGRIDLVEVDKVRAAIAYHQGGMDFADALHVAQAEGESFLTLDRALRRKAAKLNLPTEAP